jgi:excisionase family DNA binding protein
MDERRLLTGRETAKLIGVSERTIFAVTKPRGQLTPTRIGRRVMFQQRDIDAFLASCRQS